MKKLLSILTVTLLVSSASFAQVPDFTMQDTHGKTWNLYTELASGKAVMLDFFATWCGPCKSSTPALQQMWTQHGKENGSLMVFGIDVDQSENDAMVDAFKMAYGPNADYPGFTQQQTSTMWAWASGISGSNGIPQFFLINPDVDNPANSTVVQHWVGWSTARPTEWAAAAHSPTVGINEIKSIDEVVIYPNPASTNATIEFNLDNEENLAINIYDVTGKLVNQIGNTTYSVGNQKITIDGSNLENGLYYVNIVSESGVITQRLMINK